MITPGISDSQFIRGQVPMTKEEVRIVSVCKLHLNDDSVLYDIGSGTGSISVEAARLNSNIKVYAVEAEEDAFLLTSKNAEKFGLKNIQPVRGLAPEAFEKLPSPTHAFIGGTKGNLKPILLSLYRKNPSMRVVINAVSMETITEVFRILKEFPVENLETVQLQVNKTKQLGSYNMLSAENPVFIFAFDFKESEWTFPES